MASSTVESAFAPGPMAPLPFRVTQSRNETADTWTLELEPLERSTELRFAAGQFNMLGAFGRGEVPISISGDPKGGQTLIHTVRAVGAVTEAICRARPGQVLSVRGPFGKSWPVDSIVGSDVLVITGGIGLAPLRPVIYQLLAERERYGQVALLYGGRDPEQLLFSDEFDSWRNAGADVSVTVDTAGRTWRGSVGLVTKLLDRATFDRGNVAALLCGPEVMMRATISALGERGVTSEQIYCSLERNMQCAIGHCGHCQLGPSLVCRDGPVYRLSEIEHFFAIREL